jgi:hypothetical protein
LNPTPTQKIASRRDLAARAVSTRPTGARKTDIPQVGSARTQIVAPTIRAAHDQMRPLALARAGC